MNEHVVSPRTYLLVFGALMVLTFVTTEAARVDLGPFNVVIALAIAGFKAVLVVLFFMHVRHSSRLIWVSAAAGLLWLAILIGLLMADYGSRRWLPPLPEL